MKKKRFEIRIKSKIMLGLSIMYTITLNCSSNCNLNEKIIQANKRNKRKSFQKFGLFKTVIKNKEISTQSKFQFCNNHFDFLPTNN